MKVITFVNYCVILLYVCVVSTTSQPVRSQKPGMNPVNRGNQQQGNTMVQPNTNNRQGPRPQQNTNSQGTANGQPSLQPNNTNNARQQGLQQQNNSVQSANGGTAQGGQRQPTTSNVQNLNNSGTTQSTNSSSNKTADIIQSAANIGKEIISIFSSDDEKKGASDPTNTGTSAPGNQTTGNPGAVNMNSMNNNRPPRDKTKFVFTYTQGKSVLNGDTKTCETGNGICAFSIYPENQVPKESKSVLVNTQMMPRQKKLIIDFVTPIDATMQNDAGKTILTVRRTPTDSTNADGAIMIRDRKIFIVNGDYEVVNNHVELTIDVPALPK
ncbi:MAG: hypothetical protein U0Y96_01960 [Candidatus Kapaibacterium sp.]|nr:hypothetical protein [Bacteroidota bacterium]